MRATDDVILVTGATGLVGRLVVRALLERTTSRIAVLVRDPVRWQRIASHDRCPSRRLIALHGDITRASLGLSPESLSPLRHRIRVVVHCAADIVFSRPLATARATNTHGTRNVVTVAQQLRAGRFVYVSTAFAVGRRTGCIRDDDRADASGWVNAYEQSKHEAEDIVRASGLEYLIARPSTIVCDDVDGQVSQVNAVHRALRLYHAGLASMMPGEDRAPVDVVPARWVASAIATLASGTAHGTTVHLCAGAGALALGDLLDRTYELWARDLDWRRRGIARPALSTLETYELFEQSVELVGNARLQRITRSLSHFVPQLALPKWFSTDRATALQVEPAPAVSTYWTRMLEHLRDRAWRATAREVAA